MLTQDKQVHLIKALRVGFLELESAQMWGAGATGGWCQENISAAHLNVMQSKFPY